MHNIPDSEESSIIQEGMMTKLERQIPQKWKKYLAPILLVVLGIILILLYRSRQTHIQVEEEDPVAKFIIGPNPTPKQAFEHIYSKNLWDPSGKYPSGSGSIPWKNLRYLIILQHIIDTPHINNIVEIGFGDWQITGKIIFNKNQKYIGYDVVDSLLRINQTNKQFRLMKDIEDFDESGDLLIIKDVLMHWPNAKVKYFMDNVVPRFKYVLLTSDYTIKPRKDIPYGLWRGINLQDYEPKQLLLTIDNGFENQKRTYILPSMPSQ